MRVVVTGASGNVGTSVVEALLEEKQVTSVVGVCRRAHDWRPPRTQWRWADLARDDLDPVVADADVAIHLAWLFHPMRHPEVTWDSNVIGSQRLFEAVHRMRVPALVVASSVGAYSPRQHLDPVDESWPTDGMPLAAYSREKAYVERLLDLHQARHPDRRVVRMRPGFIFQNRSAIQQRRLFLGPFVPEAALHRGRLPVLPLPADLRLQTLHTEDVAAAYVRAALGDVEGAFNLASDPVLDARDLAEVLGARWVAAPARVVRTALAAGFRLHAVPTAPELFDLLMSVPVLDVRRAHELLGWQPRHTAQEAVAAFLRPLAGDDHVDTPPLPSSSGWRTRVDEIATGLGERD